MQKISQNIYIDCWISVYEIDMQHLNCLNMLKSESLQTPQSTGFITLEVNMKCISKAFPQIHIYD